VSRAGRITVNPAPPTPNERRATHPTVHVIRSGSLVVQLDERLGGEITRIRHADVELLAFYDWMSPVRASRSVGYGDPKLDWLSEYRGGWQLLVPNAGAACVVDGVPLPFHGEWSRTHVTVTERAADRVVMVAGTRLPLVVERQVGVETDPDRVIVRTTVSNPSDRVVPFVWGEHPAFAVEHGDEVDLPSAQVLAADGTPVGDWPAVSEGGRLDRVDTTHPTESVHFVVGLAAGWAGLRRREAGVALAWDVADFPAVWLWHEIASPSFPFYGRSSLVAIEPASCWPGDGLGGAVARGQALMLAPGETRSTTVAVIPFASSGRALCGATVDGRLEFLP
jgi:galactose mutarotase-like enzyme